MKYLVKAKPIESKKKNLGKISYGSLGRGSVAFGEYVKNMKHARVLEDGSICWIETCFCKTPLNEEMPYWQVLNT